MFNIVLLEAYKIFTKWRTYIGFLTIGIIVPLIVVGLELSGINPAQGAMFSFQEEFITTGNLFNGWFLSHLIMHSLFVHIPFLITLVAGDSLAGEATSGTYRILLTRPVSRTKVIIIKYITTIFYTTTLVVFLAALSVGLGHLFFGGGDLIIFRDGILLLPFDEVWWRFLLAYFCALIAMWTVASLAFLSSSFVENAIGPIVGTMAVLIIFFILGELPIEFFKTLKPYLFTTYATVWMKAFEEPVNFNEIFNSVSYLCIYCGGFFLTTLYLFRRKDILS
ncbi:MAG: ABC transporter permease subunit [Bacteroidota bacterium]|nr:ABC transporter permease subunit [Bacteroidota bacterium]